MATDVKKSVLRNFEDFLRKDVMEVVKGISVDRQIPRQMIPAAVPSSKPSVYGSSIRPTPSVNTCSVRPPVKGKLLYFPSKKRMGA